MTALTCPTCDACPHEDVEIIDVGDVIDGNRLSGVHVSLTGECNGCGAKMTGTGRQTDPDGGIEDEEWELDECLHGWEPPKRGDE